MYDLHDYARMMADEARMGPYLRALEAVIRPGSVVADIGTGTGILALVACRLGARRVYAIETSDLIDVGRELARENAMADRIVFFQEDARKVELPERVDVIVSDLRGMLPLHGNHLAVIADARARFLRSGGVLIPARDRLMVAVVENAELYEFAVGPGCGPLGVTLESMCSRLRNAPISDSGANSLQRDNVVSTAATWATLEYETVQAAPLRGSAELCVERASTGHGLALWFEATLHGEHGFSSGPGQRIGYDRVFLHWARPVALSPGDRVTVEIWAQAGGGPWGWNSLVGRGAELRAAFKQSSFLAAAGKLVRRSPGLPFPLSPTPKS